MTLLGLSVQDDGVPAGLLFLLGGFGKLGARASQKISGEMESTAEEGVCRIDMVRLNGKGAAPTGTSVGPGALKPHCLIPDYQLNKLPSLYLSCAG